jgi:hypothetical protein
VIDNSTDEISQPKSVFSEKRRTVMVVSHLETKKPLELNLTQNLANVRSSFDMNSLLASCFTPTSTHSRFIQEASEGKSLEPTKF